MKKLIVLLLILNLGYAARAQNGSIIEVQGVASVSTSPTETIISMELQSKKPTYALAIEDLNDRSNTLQKELNKLDFEDEDIITTQYNVRKNTIYERGAQKDDGYVAVQTLEIRFKNDSRKLLKVINSVTKSSSSPEIALRFDIDSETRTKLKEQLLAQAMKNARKKADIIAKEANYLITGIKMVNYGSTGSAPRPYKAVAYEMASARYADENVMSNIQAGDLTLTDQVYVVFEIKKQ